MKPMADELEERRGRLAEALAELRGRAEGSLGAGAGARWVLPLVGLAMGVGVAFALRAWSRRDRGDWRGLAERAEGEPRSRYLDDPPDPDDPYSDLDRWYQGEGRRDF